VLYLAEFYLPQPDLADVARRARAASDPAQAVRFLQAISVPADESCFAIFDAPSADAVVAAGARAAITFDRVVEARTVS
jgi:hypothetical protein